jgi:hypothetical protein
MLLSLNILNSTKMYSVCGNNIDTGCMLLNFFKYFERQYRDVLRMW